MSAPGSEVDAGRIRLQRRRDQALRDLLELEGQVLAGEVAPAAADELRRRYERTAAESIALLAAGTARQGSRERGADRRPTWRLALYGAGALAAIVALVVVLPPALQDRPAGGFVSGNEMLRPTGTSSPARPAPTAGRDLSKVSDGEMEAVVDANPDVVGMRLALAQRYLDRGDFTKALPHYRRVLERQPGNAVALASVGWVMLQFGDATSAARFADRAVVADATLPTGWWVQANIRLYARDDPAGALEALQRMQQLPLQPQVKDQVATLMTQAQTRAAAKAGGTP